MSNKTPTRETKATRQAKLNKLPKHIADLYDALDNYVTKLGGKIVIIGGVEVQEWPNDPKHSFRMAIKCVGFKPKYHEDLGKLQ